MSIYCSTFEIGGEHTNKCARIKKLRPKVYEQDDSKECTCKACPISYQGSHVLPSNNDKRAGVLSLGAIPGHIRRAGREPLSDDFMPYHPWLRVSLWETPNGDPTVLLTKNQVIALRDELTRWIDNSGVRGKGAQ